MSKSELTRFKEMLNNDATAKAIVIGMGADLGAVAAFATQHGFALCASDFSLNEELSEEDLDGIAGGEGGPLEGVGPLGAYLQF